MSCFSDLENVSQMIDESEKELLKKLGEKFYGNMDMEKYGPKFANENTDLRDDEDIRKIKYFQLKKAMQSGLLFEDLSEDEKALVEEFEKLEA